MPTLWCVGGFIVFGDGRAFAISNAGTDAVIQALATELRDDEFRDWVLSQQSSLIGLGMTSIDVRELSPRCGEEWYAAIRKASSAVSEARPDDLPYGLQGEHWPDYFRLLLAMLEASEAGEPPDDLNPHMRAVLPPTGQRRGPGWN